jgi:small subunit ribosomal protein S7
MSRKGQARVREVTPDPKFHDRTVAKFVNVVMERGKKSVAENILYSALDLAAERTKEDGLVVFKRALDNVRPAVEVRSRRVGGANYQVPVEVRPVRRTSLAMRWLVTAARARGERSMEERLAAEILEAAANRGGAVKKREDTHRMAEANRAFAHYRW